MECNYYKSYGIRVPCSYHLWILLKYYLCVTYSTMASRNYWESLERLNSEYSGLDPRESFQFVKCLMKSLVAYLHTVFMEARMHSVCLPTHTVQSCTGLIITLWGFVLCFFFCPSLPVDAFRPTQPFLAKVKVDRGVQYKVAYRWPLAELKLVDGKSLDQVRMILWWRTELIIGERNEYETRETHARIHREI